jgi:hypothetical protein
MVNSAHEALSKGAATLESLARQEEMERKMETKLAEIDYHMTVSKRLVRGLESFKGTVQNIMTYHQMPTQLETNDEIVVKKTKNVSRR